MKNDFDFIKERIEESGVKAPENMGESYVLEKLSDTKPKVAALPNNTPKKKGGVWKPLVAAASFVLVAGIAAGVGVHMYNKSISLPAVDKNIGLIRFENRDQVIKALGKINTYTSRYGAVTDEEYAVAENSAGMTADGAAPASGSKSTASGSSGAKGSGASSESHSDTYKQVDGVDEADVIKTDGRYIYVVEHYNDLNNYSSSDSVAVFDADPGESEPIVRISPEDSPKATPDEATPDETDDDSETSNSSWFYISDIFLKDDRLIVICGRSESKTYNDYFTYSYEEYTVAYVFDISDIENATLLDSYTQSGSLVSSRMIGDNLYLVSNDYEYSAIPVCGRGATPDEMPADCIYSVEKPSESSFLIVTSYDTADFSSTADTKAILGIGDDIYCNQDNMYIAAAEWNYRFGVWDEEVITYGAADDEEDYDEEDFNNKITTKIFKVSLSDGVQFVAGGEVEGYTNDQWSFDEWNGNLRVATTTYNEDYEDINNLYVLDSNLDIIGSVTGFAETESIKAVRYMGDTAYVITYEQTDPLFVIDLSSPTSPEILGEVKISGFSTMLVPVDANTVLGIGVNTGEYDYTTMEVQDGIKLALFDVSDKSNPKVLDSKSYVNYSSDVTYNPKALVYNPERGDYVIPMNYYLYSEPNEDYGSETDNWSYEDWESYWEKNTVRYGVVLNFSVENGKIVETDFAKTDHPEIGRCVYVGDDIYMTYTDDNNSVHLDSVSYK